MYRYYKIKKDKVSSYSGLKAFIEFPHSMYEPNISEKDGIYYYYRLAPGHQDTVVMTKVKLEDLEEVDLNGNVIVPKKEIEEKTYFEDYLDDNVDEFCCFNQTDIDNGIVSIKRVEK